MCRGIKHGGDVGIIFFMALFPSFRTTDTRFFRSGVYYANFGVLEFDAVILQILQKRNADITAAEVIVSSVDYRLVICDEVKTDKEGDEYQACQSCDNEIVHSRESRLLYAVYREIYDSQCDIVKRAEKAGSEVEFKENSAKEVVKAHFPNCVRVTVEEYSSLYFAGRLFGAVHVMAGFFRKCPVDEVLIENRLHKADK